MVQLLISMPKQQRQKHFTQIGVKLVDELNNNTKKKHTWHVLHCATALMDLYKCLGNLNGGAHHLGGLRQTVCEEYNWLNNEAWHTRRNVWHVQRKFHMFQYGTLPKPGIGQPQGFWACKDADFVGWVSKLAKRWGGPSTHTSQTDNVILRYKASASGC